MSESKSIEVLMHDYVVAHIQSGKPIQQVDIDNYCKLAINVKDVSRKAQKDIDDWSSRRRGY